MIVNREKDSSDFHIADNITGAACRRAMLPSEPNKVKCEISPKYLYHYLSVRRFNLIFKIFWKLKIPLRVK
jgi:hypothetical protein